MAILVIADYHTHTGCAVLAPATLNALAAARQIGGDVHLLLAGTGLDPLAEQARQIESVARIVRVDDSACDHLLAENLCALVVQLAPGYSHILAPATAMGRDCLPRIAALLDVDAVSDVITVIDSETFQRPIYAGNAIATVRCEGPVKVLGIRPTAFDPVAAEGGNAELERRSGAGDLALASWQGEERPDFERPALESARVIVAGGRGLQTAEGFAALYPLAERLQGAVGASLAAVDAGFAPAELQIGQSGRIVAPELYLAVGISGAVQHVAGMKDAKVIVAINLDPEAPIFEVADYGLQGDLFDLLPQLQGELDRVLG
ncbi:electron transfer flavoprotein subunit alpha/FixB family protein [Pseudomonas nitroreducens]|uniref:electron transfer flavoprotein subunit alpha/FixB family protein n=1 Tax=Pseudomonas nitroreducens TaxID=46680 RepID=UPI00209F404C|nr:FAD-binding protein [Pseudomonas nitroreducens]MCP1622623.1 electron transfer flavoprotein alpha subunit [Pseudomonas nitroreducens]